jgi:DNA-binding NtrC family response regulator
MKSARVLLLDLNPRDGLCDPLRQILESSGQPEIELYQESVAIDSLAFSYRDLAKDALRFDPELIFITVSASLLEVAGAGFQAIKAQLPQIPIIAAADAVAPDSVLELLRLGASDFITPPLRAIDILPRMWRLLGHRRRLGTSVHALKEKLGLRQLVGESPAFVSEVQKFPLVAKSDASVLISGETGTGKELCARAIHYLSPRANKPFVPINCGAIPVELVENELFGHEREAFTGANSSRLGLIHESDGGTLFLDEIDCLPLLAQVKLSRFLQEKEYRPLGSMKLRRADVRVISATNIDLLDAVRQGKLRQDLYYRLNIVPVSLPPLRERKEDILLLSRHFLAKYAARFNKPAVDFSPAALQTLMSYDWPGNVRELEHVVERALVFSEDEIIQAGNILLSNATATPRDESFQEAKARVVAQFERRYIRELLIAHRGNITKAAQAAHKNRRAFWQLIRKHKIDVASLKATG